MTLLVALLILGSIGLAVVMTVLLRNVVFPKTHLPITTAWIEELSVDRYRPMMRLLDSEDIDFLAMQPGFNPETIHRMRHQRCRIFRAYLRELQTDFACICMAIKVILLQSKVDRPELASTLVRAQCSFALRTLAVHAGLAVYQLGLGRVEVSGLLQLFDSMQVQLRSLVPQSATWGS